MNLADMLAASPDAACDPITNPMSLGYVIVDLPPEWRKTRANAIGDTPAVSWIDGSHVAPNPDDVGGTGLFVSVAVLIGWRLQNLKASLNETAELFARMTQDVPGWARRTRQDELAMPQSVSIRLLGTLESPYGPLISNSHSIVTRSGSTELTAIQLSVTATRRWEAAADQIRCHPESA
ncbi:hypothetical protein [Williamsia sp. CHRR-6]|uniref:hypothetical protein n=1 Tax=Williamsia sp. CHRR-6 TaxID=2835871 RepID=UPI001BDACA86|nr:hypothetical protein [Williamsia sp. CHRR-6]MBT0566090.1 hypothetical protein [Williamsia sp. CHRR-6]